MCWRTLLADRDLAGDPGPHVVRVDLGERVATELRQQLAAQDPALALAGLINVTRPGRSFCGVENGGADRPVWQA